MRKGWCAVSASTTLITAEIDQILAEYDEDVRFEGEQPGAELLQSGALLNLARHALEKLRGVNDATKARIPKALVSDEEKLRVG